MQIDGNCSYLGKSEMQVCYWIPLKLRKQQRLELPKLLEALAKLSSRNERRKAKSSLLEVFPPSVQLLNGLLKNLGRYFTQSREFFLSFRQVIELLDLSRKLQIRRKDILFLKRASIYQALTTKAPIFYLPKCVVIRTTTDIHPLDELAFLREVWIDSVTVGKSQHFSIVILLLVMMQPLTINLRGIEPLKLTWGSPCIPTPNLHIMARR